MKEKCLNEFLKLFGKFKVAVYMVAKELGCSCTPNPSENEISEIETLTDGLIQCRQIHKDHKEWNILYNFLEEIKQNLYKNPSMGRIYLKSVIDKFKDIAPYTNMDEIYCIENMDSGICTKKGDTCCYQYILYIHQFFKGSVEYYKTILTSSDIQVINSIRHFFELPDAINSTSQRYLSECYKVIDLFATKLYQLCQIFEIDLMELQNSSGIYLQRYKGLCTNKDYLSSETPAQNQQQVTSIEEINAQLGILTLEQTKDLFDLVNGVVFEETSIENFVESLNNPDNNTLRICNRGKAKAIILFHELDSVYGGENIMSKRQMILSSFDPPFDKYYVAHSGDSEYARLSPVFKTNLNTIFK